MFANILVKHEAALAWAEEEKGCFDARYIPPYKIPLIPHVSWQDKTLLSVRRMLSLFSKRKKKMACMRGHNLHIGQPSLRYKRKTGEIGLSTTCRN